MNFGSSFSRNEVVDPIGANWVRNDRIVTFSDGDSSHPSSSSSGSNTPTKVTLPQFFAKSNDHVPGKAHKTKDLWKTNPTIISEEDKPSPKEFVSTTPRRLDPPGVLADEQVEKPRKTPRRKKSKSSNNKEGSGRTRHKDERRTKKEGHRKQPIALECDETIVSWTRTPDVDISERLYTTAEAFHKSRRLSNDGQLLRLKASKSKRNIGYNCLDASLVDVTSTTTKTTNSEISEIVRRIQANPKSPNPRRVRNDRRSIQSHKRLSRGLDRRASSTRLTMVASPTKIRKGTTSSRKNSLTCANQIEIEHDPRIPDSPVKQTEAVERRKSVAPLDFSEFENEDFSAGDGVAAIVVETAD